MEVKDRSLISLSWPLILTFGIATVQPMMDSWFLAKTSENAAAGVGALMPLLGALFMAIQAFSQAGASIASQFLGAHKKRKASVTQTMVLTGSLLLGFSLTFIVLPLSETLVRLMGLSGETALFAEDFLNVVSFGFAFRALQTTLTALIATHGLTVWNLFGNVLTILSNALLNILFLNGYFGLPSLGVKGVALATLSSWLISSVILGLVLRYKVHYKTRTSDFSRLRLILPNWIRIGLPAAAEPVSFQLFQVCITAMVVHFGTLAMTSRVFSANFAMLAVILSVGLGSGNQILVAHLVGAHDFTKADKRLHQSLCASVLGAFLVALLVAVSGEHLLSVYTQNEAILKLGKMCLWCDVFLQPFKAANVVLTNALRASGDSKFPAVVGTLMMWTLGLSSAILLGFYFELGLIGLWIGMALDEFYRSIVNYRRWKSGKWQKYCLT